MWPLRMACLSFRPADVLRIVPPLTITDEETAEGLARLRDALADFVEEAKVA